MPKPHKYRGKRVLKGGPKEKTVEMQSKFNGSSIFETMKVCSAHGYFEPLKLVGYLNISVVTKCKCQQFCSVEIKTYNIQYNLSINETCMLHFVNTLTTLILLSEAELNELSHHENMPI